MTLKVLEILVDRSKIGSLVFNGIEGTILRKVYLPIKYKQRITRGNLLIKGHNYNTFEMPDYISRLTKGLSNDFEKKVEIVEKNLSPLEKAELNKFTNNMTAYRTYKK